MLGCAGTCYIMIPCCIVSPPAAALTLLPACLYTHNSKHNPTETNIHSRCRFAPSLCMLFMSTTYIRKAMGGNNNITPVHVNCGHRRHHETRPSSWKPLPHSGPVRVPLYLNIHSNNNICVNAYQYCLNLQNKSMNLTLPVRSTTQYTYLGWSIIRRRRVRVRTDFDF